MPGREAAIWFRRGIAPPCSNLHLVGFWPHPVTVYIRGHTEGYTWGFYGSPYNKDYSILGSILGSAHLGKLPYKDIIQLL